MIKKWPYKLKSFNLKNEKYLKNDKKWSCIAGFKVFLKIKGCNNTITQVGQKRWYKMDLFNTSQLSVTKMPPSHLPFLAHAFFMVVTTDTQLMHSFLKHSTHNCFEDTDLQSNFRKI